MGDSLSVINVFGSSIFGNPSLLIYLRTDTTMPLITPSTFVHIDEPTQPQAHLTAPSSNNYSSPLQHVESAPPAAVAITIRGEATQTGTDHSRFDQQTEREMSPVEEMMLVVRSWHNSLCYSDVSVECAAEVLQNYCCSLWCDFSNLVGLSSTTNTTAHWRTTKTGMLLQLLI